MTTYEETQTRGSNHFEYITLPGEYDLPARSEGDRLVRSHTSDPRLYIVLAGVPSDISPATALRQLARVAIWWTGGDLLHVYWSAVADLEQGAILNVKRGAARDGGTVIAQVKDPVHWTGNRCIGWFVQSNA